MTNPVTIDAPAGLPFVEFVREFDAPVEAIFRAHREPDLVAQWLGPRGYEMRIDHWDFVSGGSYDYVHRDPARGAEFGFRGTFHTVREPEIAIQTFEFDGAPDAVSLESMTFERLEGGRTRMRGHAVYPSVEVRDAMVEHGWEEGVVDSYERLDEVVAALVVA
ncbi:activator of HSP90 ATPase [Agromyces rhizosphaerae]|uniref:Activator of HSP90 ATPase n=1 Tax=Agromyces rhizosphaerae TaxID=88374 RepID=A0A9W6FPS0_9MICO|nr:SRPBCC family protein [Agromyces rhizosphaerae]GLI27811.1 activator of HSP90 ATPase [Agromyces rhizosphaerae]